MGARRDLTVVQAPSPGGAPDPAGGATLIDPSAHGGHREYDLAMLDLFGAPHLGTLRAAYHGVWPLEPRWQERVGLHQIHALAVHALLFGGGYAAQTLGVARRYARGQGR